MPARYEISETPHGWQIFKTFGNGGCVGGPERTRELAEAKMARVNLAEAKRFAFADARRRAGNQCECGGVCGVHPTRCSNIGGDTAVGLGEIGLQVIVVNHDAEDLGLDNLRVVCQLCRQYHDAEAFGGEALFDIAAGG